MLVGTALLDSSIDGATLARRGKVRDVYAAGDDLLIVATDRISAFDYVLPTGIPDKGRVLTQLSLFWFDRTRHIVPNHVLSGRVEDFPPPFNRHAQLLEGRSMLVRKARPILVECVARGYLSGSGWKEYRETGRVGGIELPAGLRESDRLDPPIFTPATKAESGHDVNITFEEAGRLVGHDLIARLRDLTLALYQHGARHAESRGIIVADTKFEFGLVEGDRIILIDEALTPDSSRFWPQDGYQPGRPQPSFDKQYVRDYLESLRWNKQPPVPALPPDVVERTREKYLEAYVRLAGQPLG